MSPFLPLGMLKRKDQSTDSPSPQKPVSTPPSLPTSPLSPSMHSTPPRSPGPVPNTDTLPLNVDALFGLLNARNSQLQKLADRIESVNEWLEMDGIVLAKLTQDISVQVDKEEEAERASKEAVARAQALWKENNPTVPAASRGPVSPASYRGGNVGSSHRRVSGDQSTVRSGESRVPEVFLKGLSLSGKSKEERINEHCGVRDLRERIKAMKSWRREIERTVCWQRDECRRVQEAINRQSDRSEGSGISDRGASRRVVQFEEDDDADGKGEETEGARPVKETGVLYEEGWGVGGQTWEKKSGKVPSQSEWEKMFSDERIGWDDQGVQRRYLGC